MWWPGKKVVPKYIGWAYPPAGPWKEIAYGPREHCLEVVTKWLQRNLDGAGCVLEQNHWPMNPELILQ